MKEKSIVICCYAILILIGGFIGYVVANSLPSLIASSFFALILLACAVLVRKGHMIAYQVATVIAAFLFAFFTYRFSLTYKIAPAGIMAIISCGMMIYLVTQRKKLTKAV